MIRWLDPLPVQVPAEFEALHLSPIVNEALVRRGFTDLGSARAFLDPQETASARFPGMEAAVELVLDALKRGGKICVWGDFDVDGQTSTTLLVQTLRSMGADPVHHIPIRASEGHGVHAKSLATIIEGGTGLLITCDTGITAHEAVNFARAAGIKVLITDHHLPEASLPDANAILNPRLLPEQHPLADLSGVGVAYKLAEALVGEKSAQLIDLVGLGLIADVALLRGETRSLAQRGIQALRRTERLGLRIMAENSQTVLDSATEETIGFTLAPRLNALGRLDDANRAVEFLLSQDLERVRVIASQIESLNAQRRLLTSQVYRAAEAQLQKDPGLLSSPLLILSQPGWPGGVIGIAASRLAERYNKPVILLSAGDDGILRGSARSVENLHITNAIASQARLLTGFGGHPMAAGLSLPAEKLAEFRRGAARAVEQQMGAAIAEEPTLMVDAWIGLDEMTLELAESLEILAPFGAGNPELVFAVRGVTLRSITEVGRSHEHLRLSIEDEAGRSQNIIWWSASEEDLPEIGSRIDIAFSLRASTYRGQRQIAARFIDYRIIEEAKPSGGTAPRYEFIDLRAETKPENRLFSLKETNPELMVWSEGTKRDLGRGRHELRPAEEFAIYAMPPSAGDLHEALKKTAPRKVFLFAIDASEKTRMEFLNHLAGLCKYAISQRAGKASVVELAAATSQREMTIRHGLGWLQAGGNIRFEGEEELTISGGDGTLNQGLKEAFSATLDSLLEETSAYRRFYSTSKDPLLVQPKI